MNNIPTNLSVAAQLPNDPKVWAKSTADISSLGPSDHLAYTYYEGMRVFCATEREIYEWREVQPGEENTGLVTTDYTYPSPLIVNDIDYSNRSFNFLKELQASDIVLPTIDNYNAANVGTGAGIFKDETNPSANTYSFNFKSLLLSSVGTGVSLIKDINPSANELDIRIKNVVSDSLTITSDGDDVRFELPTTTSIPALYVNNLYVPTYQDFLNPDNLGKGEGTLSKPFTDSYTINPDGTVASVIPNTAIQNAIDGNPTKSYVGTGGRGTILDPALPDRIGQTIIIQNNNNITYVFEGDWALKDVTFKLEEGTGVQHIPTTANYLVDMELFSSSLAVGITIFLSNNSNIFLSKNGFRNKGTVNPGTSFANSKVISIVGEKGRVTQIQDNAFHVANPDTYCIIDSNWDNTAGYFNDSNLTFNIVGVELRSATQTIYKIGGDRIIDFTDTLFAFGVIGSNVSTSAKPFRHKGGHYNRSQNCKYDIFGNQTINITFELDNTCTLLMEKPRFNGTVKSLFYNVSTTDRPILRITNSYTNDGINMTAPDFNILDSNLAVGKWDTIFMNNCFITRGTIDYSKIDMTRGNLQSSVNYIGRPVDYNIQVHEDLVRRVSRVNALLDLPLGSRFINTNGMNPDGVSDPSWKLDIAI